MQLPRRPGPGILRGVSAFIMLALLVALFPTSLLPTTRPSLCDLGLRPFVLDRNIRHFLWYGGVAGDGLRSVGEEALPSSKSVCSILPIARHSRAGVSRASHPARPLRPGSSPLHFSQWAPALLPALTHRSAGKGTSANFGFTEFSEVELLIS